MAIVIGVLYFIVGYGSAALDPSLPNQMRFAWRLSAWAFTAVVFAAHISYEQVRARQSVIATATHVASAVAIGGFLLAAAATIRTTIVTSQAPDKRYFLALVLWPVGTAVPALLVALFVAVGISQLRKRRGAA